PAEAVEKAVDRWLQAQGKKSLDEEPGEAVKKLVWAPLVKHLKGAATVLVSPDGVLSRLPLSALPGDKEKTYLLEEVALTVVPVPQAIPAMLAPVKEEARLKASLLVVGSVDFDGPGSHDAAPIDSRVAPRGPLKGWAKLPGTRAEALAVKDSFGQQFEDGGVIDLREARATKRAVREARPRG